MYKQLMDQTKCCPFRKNCGTATAPIESTSGITKNVEEADLVLLHYSKALDCVHRELIISKLKCILIQNSVAVVQVLL